MSKIDLSTEALMERRALAERATPGPWGVKCKRHDNTCHENLIFTENGNKIVGTDKIDPREVYYRDLPEAICSLDTHDAAHIAANSPDVVIATIDELLRLREESERLEKEADWLAERLAKYCVDDAEKECPLIDVCPEGSCPTITTSSWREVAHRAVEEV